MLVASAPRGQLMVVTPARHTTAHLLKFYRAPQNKHRKRVIDMTHKWEHSVTHLAVARRCRRDSREAHTGFARRHTIAAIGDDTL